MNLVFRVYSFFTALRAKVFKYGLLMKLENLVLDIEYQHVDHRSRVDVEGLSKIRTVKRLIRAVNGCPADILYSEIEPLLRKLEATQMEASHVYFYDDFVKKIEFYGKKQLSK